MYNSELGAKAETFNLYSKYLSESLVLSYLNCFNKTIIDPDNLYPSDVPSCLYQLYKVSLLQ